MKRVIKWIVVAVALLVVGVVGGAYVISPVARVERAIEIKAPADKVFAIVSNMRRFNEWSPWYGVDPGTEYRFEGPAEGVGQKMLWSSADPQVGKGTQTIIAIEPDRKVVTEIDFGGMGRAEASISLAPLQEGTAVIWRFEAPVEGIAERWTSLMFDRWIGADYVRGLGLLKQLAEAEDKAS